MPDGKTPNDVLAMEAGARYWYLIALTDTNETLAALVIQVALQLVRPDLAVRFFQRFEKLVREADPVGTYMLAARFIDTPHKRGKELEVHQFFSTLLHAMLAQAGYHSAGVEYMPAGLPHGRELASGTFKRRLLPGPGSSELSANDHVIYSKRGIRRMDGYRRRTVRMIRVEVKDQTWG